MIGPILMESRKPYTLRNLLKVYNFVQVCISGYMFKEVSFMNYFEMHVFLNKNKCIYIYFFV